jgi:TBC1 domain family member 20
VLKKLISLADPTYAALLNRWVSQVIFYNQYSQPSLRNLPLPYYALSNLLTLFAHDVPTLPLVQHVFDYLLVRPPIAVVYLAAAVGGLVHFPCDIYILSLVDCSLQERGGVSIR